MAANINTNGNILKIGLLFVAVSVAATSTERLETTAGARVIDIATESSGLWLVVYRASPSG